MRPDRGPRRHSQAAVRAPGVITTVRGRAVGGPSFFGLVLGNRRYHSTDRIAGQVEVAGLDPDDDTPTAIKTDREGFVTSHPRYEAYARFMTATLERIAKDLEARADAERDARRRAKLNEAVRHATEVLNAFTERERRLLPPDSVDLPEDAPEDPGPPADPGQPEEPGRPN
jgi:hypothetical protein